MSHTATIQLSKKGLKDLKKSITKLEKQIAMEQKELKDLDKGDSREDRLALTEKLSSIESLEAELQEKIYTREHAKLYPRKRDALKVALGSVVDLMDKNGRMVRYTLVSSLEANPSDGRISVNSPLGRSLVGRSLRETIEWSVGLRANKLQLMRISYKPFVLHFVALPKSPPRKRYFLI